MPKKILLPLISSLVIAAGTFLAIKFGQGYRPNLKNLKNLQGTGLLVANSFPSGAQVFINNKLTTATDDTLNLPPGEYQIEIKKDGFTPWNKTLKLEAELVTQTNATLFPSVPTLRPLTFTGALNPLPSPDGQKIVYAVNQAANPAQTGLWLLELNPGTPLIRSKQPKQLARNDGIKFSQAKLTWSPDSTQILVHTQDANYLLDSNRFNDLATLKDVTARLPVILSSWEQQLARKQHQQLLALPEKLQTLLPQNATNLYFSPDEQKLLYTATKQFTLPDSLIPALPASSTQLQHRQLEPGAIYVYDLKEDRNFKIIDPPPAELGDSPQLTKIFLASPDASASAHTKLQQASDLPQTLKNFTAQYTPLEIQPVQWFPTSSHLILIQDQKLTIMEYDGLNPTTIYSGAFEPNFAYPSPNGSQLIILTNLNQDSNLPPNLYSIDLK